MCVGLTAKVVNVSRGTALVDASGARRQVSSALLRDLEPGDYVMVHAGAAIAKINGNDEEETDSLMGALMGFQMDSQTGSQTGSQNRFQMEGTL